MRLWNGIWKIYENVGFKYRLQNYCIQHDWRNCGNELSYGPYGVCGGNDYKQCAVRRNLRSGIPILSDSIYCGFPGDCHDF